MASAILFLNKSDSIFRLFLRILTFIDFYLKMFLLLKSIYARVVERQTRCLEGAVTERSCGFKSRLSHQKSAHFEWAFFLLSFKNINA